jgi:hyperosmotically inducible periplasmic protein
MKKFAYVLLLIAVGLSLPAAAQDKPAVGLDQAVFDAIWSEPSFGVFDNLLFKVDGTEVTLIGQSMLPLTKANVGARVAKVKGVTKVDNQIEVLPLSENDDSIRMRAYRALFGAADLYRYAMAANPSIHIIVKGGHLTLEGTVSTSFDSQRAFNAVRGLMGVFSAKNNLKVDK